MELFVGGVQVDVLRLELAEQVGQPSVEDLRRGRPKLGIPLQHVPHELLEEVRVRALDRREAALLLLRGHRKRKIAVKILHHLRGWLTLEQ